MPFATNIMHASNWCLNQSVLFLLTFLAESQYINTYNSHNILKGINVCQLFALQFFLAY